MPKFSYSVSVVVTAIIILLSLAVLNTPSLQLRFEQILGTDNNWIEVTSPPQYEEVVVSRVVDGDTVVLEDGRRIRYLYIDTPESVKPGESPECFGTNASDYNRRLVEGRKVVLIPDIEPQDQYGRDLRLVYILGDDTADPSESVSAQLIQQGFAEVSIFPPNSTHAELMRSLQREAQASQRGLWGSC